MVTTPKSHISDVLALLFKKAIEKYKRIPVFSYNIYDIDGNFKVNGYVNFNDIQQLNAIIKTYQDTYGENLMFISTNKHTDKYNFYV